MNITVEKAFWEVFPEAQISVLVVKGLDNRVDESKDPYFKSLLDKGAKRAEDFILDENFTQNEVIQEWRQLWLISITVSRCLMQFLVAERIWIRLSEVFI